MGSNYPDDNEKNNRQPVFIKCQYCGAENMEGSRYCRACAKPFRDEDLIREEPVKEKPEPETPKKAADLSESADPWGQKKQPGHGDRGSAAEQTKSATPSGSEARTTRTSGTNKPKSNGLWVLLLACSAVVLAWFLWAVFTAPKPSFVTDGTASSASATASSSENSSESTSEDSSESTSGDNSKKSPAEIAKELPDEILDEEGNLYIKYVRNADGLITDETHYDKDGSETISIWYEISEDGKLTKEHVFNPEGTVSFRAEYNENEKLANSVLYWGENNRRENTYYEDGTLKQSVTYQNGNKSYESTYREDSSIESSRGYGENGKLSYEYSYYDDDTMKNYKGYYGDDGSLTNETSYNEKGNQTDSYYHRSDGSIEHTTYENKYDSDGLLEEQITIGDDGKIESTTKYSYDSSGNVIEEADYYEGESTPHSTRTYSYNDDGLKTEENYTWTYSDGTTYTSYERYEYDAEGRMLRNEYGDSGSDVYFWESTYDVRGLFVQSRSHEYDGTETITTVDYDYMRHLVYQKDEKK